MRLLPPSSRLRVSAALVALLACGGAGAAPGAAAGREPLAPRFLIVRGEGVNSGRTTPELEIVGSRGRPLARWSTGPSEVVAKDGTVISSWPAGVGFYGARLSPNGGLVAWVTQAGLYVARSDGRDPRLLVGEAISCLPGMLRSSSHACDQVGLTFAWSPNSRSLLVGGAGPRSDELLLVSLATGRSSQVAPARPFQTYDPVGWQPDGDAFVFLRGDEAPNQPVCCASELEAAPIAGGRPRLVYRLAPVGVQAEYGPPVLSPNGALLALRVGASIRVVAVASGAYHDLDGLGVADTLAWSPDSTRLAFLSLDPKNPGGDTVEVVSAAGGKATALGAGGWLSWVSDGELLVVRGPDQNQVWASIDGRRERLLFALPADENIEQVDAA